MPVSSASSRVLMLVAAAACWGVGTVVTKRVLAEVAPLWLLPVQLFASCLFLLLVSRVARTPITWSPSLRRLTALGVLNPGLAYALGLLGLTSISASMSVLLWASEPVLILVLAVQLLREHVPAALAVLLAVAVVGVVLVVHEPGVEGSGTGVALTLGAVAACALYTVLARRLLLDDASVNVALLQQVAALVFALVVLGLAALATGGTVGTPSPTGGTWLAAAGTGILYYGLAFWLYLSALRGVTASVAGSFITLVPVFGIAAGHVVGERLTDRQWVGVVLVVLAMALVSGRRARADRPVPGPQRSRGQRPTA